MVISDAAIVTVRNSSSRLPNKSIMKVTNDFRSIDIVIKRAQKTGFPVILATSTDPSDDIFEEIVNEHRIEIFRGSLLNKIKRWHDCFNYYKIENALLIDGDDLAYNYEIGKRAVSQLKELKIDIILNPSNIVCGFFTYAINKNAISKLFQVANTESLNTDVIHKFIEFAKLKTSLVRLEDNEYDKKIRLTLDYPEDLEFFIKLYQNVSISTNGNSIINYLENNPSTAEINFHKQEAFLENQKKFNEKIK